MLLVSILAAITLLFIFIPHTFAAEPQVKLTGTSFEIKDIVDYAQVYGIQGSSGITYIPIQIDIGNGLLTDLVITIESKVTNVQTSYSVLNINVSGSFYRTSDEEIVSVYGLAGSFKYNGDDTEITDSSHYHNATMDKWSGTSRTSEGKTEPYSISVLEGDYVLYFNDIKNNTAWIKIAVSESGLYSVGGDYVSYDVS